MLRTDEQVATVSSLNMRAEMHGEQPVPACDVNITFDAPCKFLDQFEKGMRDAFYSDEPPGKAQKSIPGAGDGEGNGPYLKFNGTLNTLSIKKEWPGYKAEIVWGDLASSIKIDLEAVKLTKIRADLKEGGTVGFALQIQAHPINGQHDQLALVLRREVRVTLTPPSASELKRLQKEQEEAKKRIEDGDGDQD